MWRQSQLTYSNNSKTKEKRDVQYQELILIQHMYYRAGKNPISQVLWTQLEWEIKASDFYGLWVCKSIQKLPTTKFKCIYLMKLIEKKKNKQTSEHSSRKPMNPSRILCFLIWSSIVLPAHLDLVYNIYGNK